MDLYLEGCRMIRANPMMSDAMFETIREQVSVAYLLPQVESYLNKRRFNNLYENVKETYELFYEALKFERYRIERDISYYPKEMLLV